MAPYFYNVSDDDGNEQVIGPFENKESSLNDMDETELNVARTIYKSLNKKTAERSLYSGSRMNSDQPLPPLPEF